MYRGQWNGRSSSGIYGYAYPWNSSPHNSWDEYTRNVRPWEPSPWAQHPPPHPPSPHMSPGAPGRRRRRRKIPSREGNKTPFKRLRSASMKILFGDKFVPLKMEMKALPSTPKTISSHLKENYKTNDLLMNMPALPNPFNNKDAVLKVKAFPHTATSPMEFPFSSTPLIKEEALTNRYPISFTLASPINIPVPSTPLPFFNQSDNKETFPCIQESPFKITVTPTPFLNRTENGRQTIPMESPRNLSPSSTPEGLGKKVIEPQENGTTKIEYLIYSRGPSTPSDKTEDSEENATITIDSHFYAASPPTPKAAHRDPDIESEETVTITIESPIHTSSNAEDKDLEPTKTIAIRSPIFTSKSQNGGLVDDTVTASFIINAVDARKKEDLMEPTKGICLSSPLIGSQDVQHGKEPIAIRSLLYSPQDGQEDTKSHLRKTNFIPSPLYRSSNAEDKELEPTKTIAIRSPIFTSKSQNGGLVDDTVTASFIINAVDARKREDLMEPTKGISLYSPLKGSQDVQHGKESIAIDSLFYSPKALNGEFKEDISSLIVNSQDDRTNKESEPARTIPSALYSPQTLKVEIEEVDTVTASFIVETPNTQDTSSAKLMLNDVRIPTLDEVLSDKPYLEEKLLAPLCQSTPR